MVEIRKLETGNKMLEIRGPMFGAYYIGYWKDGKIVFSKPYLTLHKANIWFDKYAKKHGMA
jgi:hypothetical protein